MSTAQREFDIVLYGATGFVGKLTAEYLAKAGGDARIALAGRSQDKLLAVRETLGEAAQSWPLIAADASQPSTLNEMAARAQVVVTTVGPYANTGCRWSPRAPQREPITRTSPVRPKFIRESIDHYHKQADRHRRPNRARVRIRLHPFGSHRVTRCIGGLPKTTPASLATPHSWCGRWRVDCPAAPSRR